MKKGKWEVIGMCILAADAVVLFTKSKVAALVLLVGLTVLLFLVARERIDATTCPRWDVVAYEVEQMSLEELFRALNDEEYLKYAWARLTKEFSLTIEEERKMLEALPLTREGAQLLQDYVLENQVGFHFWKHLIIESAELLTDEECSVLLDRFVEIFGVEEVK